MEATNYNRPDLENSLDDMPDCPGRAILDGRLSLESIETGDMQSAYNVVAEAYFGEDRQSGAEDLYKNLRARDTQEPLEHEPLITLAMPVGIHDESSETIMHSLSILAEQNGANQSEIILFANHPVGWEDTRNKLEGIIEAFRATYPDVHLRSVEQAYDEGEFGMGKVRKEMTDTVAYDGAMRDFRFDHPVMWVDADLEKLSPNALVIAAQEVRSPRVVPGIVQPAGQNLQIDISAEITDAERLALGFELVGRQVIRQNYKEDGQKPGYSEESGLVINLGAYMLAGGGMDEDKFQESFRLKKRMEYTTPALQQIVDRYQPGAEVAPNPLVVADSMVITSSGRRAIDTFQAAIDVYKQTGQFPNIATLSNTSGKELSYGDFSDTEAYRTQTPKGSRDLNSQDWENILSTMFSSFRFSRDARAIATYDKLFPEVAHVDISHLVRARRVSARLLREGVGTSV